MNELTEAQLLADEAGVWVPMTGDERHVTLERLAKLIARARASAPTPPAVQDAVSVLSDQITDVRQGRGFSREDWLKLRSMPHGTKLYAHPAPAALGAQPVQDDRED